MVRDAVVPAAPTEELAIAAGLDRLFLWTRRQSRGELSSSAFSTLDTLNYAGPLRISELADREGISQPGMTTLINRLAAEDFAQRLADPDDGRATLVSITPAGRSALAARHDARSEALAAVIRTLSPEHQSSLGSALAALLALTQTVPRPEEGVR